MSTGAECRFTEVEPGRWTYWLQGWPYGDNPEGHTYGPFRSFALAEDHLDQHHANPGGYNVKTHESHVHEPGHGGYVKGPFTVTIDVASLGPDTTHDAVIRHIQSLPSDHPAFRVSQRTEWSEAARSCRSCGESL